VKRREGGKVWQHCQRFCNIAEGGLTREKEKRCNLASPCEFFRHIKEGKIMLTPTDSMSNEKMKGDNKNGKRKKEKKTKNP
jgi:hypothetical protein